MLSGRVAIDRYLASLMPEFPAYSRRQCATLRRLHRRGVQVVQVEPYMAELESIHGLFEAGGRPGDLRGHPLRWPVYQAEHRWFGALLSYYAAAAGSDFERAVDAVCAFAEADAERGRLRDAMRAARLVGLLPPSGGLYVEAGSIHAGLAQELRRRVPDSVPVRTRWLTAAAIDAPGGSSTPLAPGDQLTLDFVQRGTVQRERARLLAARGLIQVAMSVKEEMLPTADTPFPHALDDLHTCRLVDDLSIEDCRELFPLVRSLPLTELRKTVERHRRLQRGRLR
jgi:hypothetical protein